MLPGLKRAPTRRHTLPGQCCQWKILLLALLFLFLSIVAENIDTTKVSNDQVQSPGLEKSEQEEVGRKPSKLVLVDEGEDGIWENLEKELGASIDRVDHGSESVIMDNEVVTKLPLKEASRDLKDKVVILPTTDTSKTTISKTLGTEAAASKGQSESLSEKIRSGEAQVEATTKQPLACAAAGADADGTVLHEICAATERAEKLQQRIVNTYVPVPKGITLVDLLLYGLPPPCEELSVRHAQAAVLKQLEGDGQFLAEPKVAGSDQLEGDGQIPAEQKVADPDHRSTRLKPLGLDEYKRTMEKHVLQKERNESAPVVPPPPPRRASTDRARYNYAAAANGAKVVAANKEAKGPSAVLDEDKDKYLRNPCSAEEKWIVIELSEEILVDTVVISNYEFYSSNPKEFEVLGSQRFPTDEWISLGTFHANNVRTPQFFPIIQPRVWIRYMMLRMKTQHGSEVYCTLSLVRVHGVDALQEFKEEMELMSQEVGKIVTVLRESSPPGASVSNPHVSESAPSTSSSTNTGKGNTDTKAEAPGSDGSVPGSPAPPLASSPADSKKGDAGGPATIDSGGSPRSVSTNSAPMDPSGRGGTSPGRPRIDSSSGGIPPESAAGGVPSLDGGSPPDVGESNSGAATIATGRGGSGPSEGGIVGSGPPGGAASGKGGGPGSTSATPSGGVGVQGGGGSRPPTGDFIFKTLMQKIKSLELNQSIFDRYVEDLNQKYLEMFGELEEDIANLEGGLRNASAMAQTLRTRLAERDARATSELEALRLDMVNQLGVITDELTTLRLHSLRLEKREAAAVGTSLLCVFVSAILYCIGVLRSHYSPSNGPGADDDDLATSKEQRRGIWAPNLCFGAAVMILFVGTSFITLILSV